jgi:hypothetical protein
MHSCKCSYLRRPAMSFFLSTTHKCMQLLFCHTIRSLGPLFAVINASCCGRAADGMQSLVRRRVLWLLTNCFCVLIDIVHSGIGCKVTHCDMRLQGVCPHGKLAQRIDSQRHASILQEGKFRQRGRTTNTAIATSTNSAKSPTTTASAHSFLNIDCIVSICHHICRLQALESVKDIQPFISRQQQRNGAALMVSLPSRRMSHS